MIFVFKDEDFSDSEKSENQKNQQIESTIPRGNPQSQQFPQVKVTPATSTSTTPITHNSNANSRRNPPPTWLPKHDLNESYTQSNTNQELFHRQEKYTQINNLLKLDNNDIDTISQTSVNSSFQLPMHQQQPQPQNQRQPSNKGNRIIINQEMPNQTQENRSNMLLHRHTNPANYQFIQPNQPQQPQSNYQIQQHQQKYLQNHQQMRQLQSEPERSRNELPIKQQQQGFVRTKQVSSHPQNNTKGFPSKGFVPYKSNRNSNSSSSNNSNRPTDATTNSKKKVHSGFQMTDAYKERFQYQSNSNGTPSPLVQLSTPQCGVIARNNNEGLKKRSGIVFDESEKLFQQVLLFYFKSDIAKKTNNLIGDSHDILLFRIPSNCIKPIPNITLRRASEEDVYYGVLQSMKDKYFMEVLDRLQKRGNYPLEQLEKFESKRMELLNNSFKNTFKILPKKKKYPQQLNNNKSSNLSVNPLYGGIIPSPGSYIPATNANNNSLIAGPNSFNEFASESSSIQGMGWDNTNLSSDQYIVNMINSLKSHKGQAFVNAQNAAAAAAAGGGGGGKGYLVNEIASEISSPSDNLSSAGASPRKHNLIIQPSMNTAAMLQQGISGTGTTERHTQMSGEHQTQTINVGGSGEQQKTSIGTLIVQQFNWVKQNLKDRIFGKTTTPTPPPAVVSH